MKHEIWQILNGKFLLWYLMGIRMALNDPSMYSYFINFKSEKEELWFVCVY